MIVFIFGLWSSCQIWQLWNALMPKRVGIVGTFFKLKNCLGQVVIQFKKSPHKSDLFRRDSISKLPGLIWSPQTKGKNVHRNPHWQFLYAITPKRVGLVQTFFKLNDTLTYTIFQFKKSRTSPTHLSVKELQSLSNLPKVWITTNRWRNFYF